MDFREEVKGGKIKKPSRAAELLSRTIKSPAEWLSSFLWWSIRNQLRVRRTPHIIVFKGLFDIFQRDILDAERTVTRVQDHREISIVEIDGIDENVDQCSAFVLIIIRQHTEIIEEGKND